MKSMNFLFGKNSKTKKDAQGSTSYSIGKSAEREAAKFLERKKWKILEYNFKTKLGEIDLIAKKDLVIIACEVKYRKDQDILPYVISKKQQGRIGDALLQFIQSNPTLKDISYRFDALLINNNFEVEHIENAWYFED